MKNLRSTILATLVAITLVAGVPGLAIATPEAGPAQDIPWWQSTICYEVFVRSFQDSDGDGIGDIQGLISRLDYLNDGVPGSGDDLGVGCIWLMPVMQSPSYHGYDVTDYRAIEEDYGTNEDFLQLMDEAHARGIHVIVDFPLNHISSQHEWFVSAASDPESPFRDWFIFSEEDPGYLGPWHQHVWHPNPHGEGFYYGIFDSSMPDLNFLNDDVNTEFRDITEFWLTEMGVDGFRMDAIKHVIKDGQVQENTPATIEWLRDYSAFVKSVAPDSFTIGEVMGGGTDSLLPYYPDTLDAFFHFDLAQTMRMGTRTATPHRIGPVLTGAHDRLPNQRWGTFLINHDEARIGSEMDGDLGNLKLSGIMLLTFPGTPFIYYGEEIGMPGEKPDPNIRTPMQWSRESSGGFTTGTPYTGMQPGWEELNVAAQDGDETSLLSSYRKWGQLREVSPALQSGELVVLETDNRQVMAFLRIHDDETMLVVINFASGDSDPVTITIPEEYAGEMENVFTGEVVSLQDGVVPSVPGEDATAYRFGM